MPFPTSNVICLLTPALSSNVIPKGITWVRRISWRLNNWAMPGKCWHNLILKWPDESVDSKNVKSPTTGFKLRCQRNFARSRKICNWYHISGFSCACACSVKRYKVYEDIARNKLRKAYWAAYHGWWAVFLANINLDWSLASGADFSRSTKPLRKVKMGHHLWHTSKQ